MNSYQIPDDRRCQVCGALMTDLASWFCGACGAAQTPPPRPAGIRGFLGDLYQIRHFMIFAVVLIAMSVAGWGSILFVGHLGGDDCNPLSTP